MGQKSNVLHFSVEGAFLTDIARNLWAEGAGSKAIGLLVEGVRMKECEALLVVTGRAKLVGLNTFKMVKDAATTDNRGLPLPASLVDALKKNEAKIAQIAEERDDIASRASATITEIDDAVIEGDDEAVGEALGYVKPEPDKTYEADTGLLSPEGDLYPCAYYEHQSLMTKLGLYDIGVPGQNVKGWLKLQNGTWFTMELDAYSRGVTQSQLDALWAWHRKRNRTLEWWMKTV